MENFISVSNPVDRSKLKADDYFRTLVAEGADKGLLSEFDLENIQLELIELLGNICLGISEKGHGSMKTEQAEKIAASIMYTVSVMLKKSPSPESALERLKAERIEAIFYEGKQEIVSLLTKARGIWAVINKELFETYSYYYNNVISEAIKEFFKSYDYNAAAHESVKGLDYPVYIGAAEENGAEEICSYLSAFRVENSFLNKFPAQNVHRLMMNLDNELKKTGVTTEEAAYKELPVNIFGYVVAATLVLGFLGKDIFSLYATKQDVESFSAELEGKSYSELVLIFDSLSEKAASELGADETLKQYLKRSVRILATEVSSKGNAMLTGMFLYRCDKAQSFSVSEKEKLSDSKYRQVLSQINSCDDEKERLNIIRCKIRNYEDFIDIVNDLSLNAYQISFCLDRFDMGEKLRLFKRYNLFSICFNEEDKKMKDTLERYVNALDASTKSLIMKLLSIMQ